ncbi:MAG: class I SAM-dependent methyltransferase [Acidobacteria bacterium]|nr:class I SAM-dependent methyltransferase [Acidobacteriota bacterium]
MPSGCETQSRNCAASERCSAFAEPPNLDLIIATTILVYYDVFEQSLALANIESALRPGGFLLSNNALCGIRARGTGSKGRSGKSRTRGRN